MNSYGDMEWIEYGQDGLLLLDEAGEPVRMNRKALDMMGMASDSGLSASHPPLPRAIRDEIDRFVRSDPAVGDRALAETACGESGMWVEMHLSRHPKGYTAWLRDLSARRNIEKEITDSHKRLVLLCEAANQMIANEEPKALLDSLFHKLSDHLGLDMFFNYIWDEREQRLHLLNYHGIPKEAAETIEWLDLGEAVCGFVAQRKREYVAENVQNAGDPLADLVRQYGVQAYACHPLISYGRLIGTLSFGTKERQSFTPDELRLMEQIGAQIAVTFERLFLMTELRDKNLELTRNIADLIEAKEKAERASHAKTVFLSMMSHELRTPLHSIIGFTDLLLDAGEPLSETQRFRTERIRNAGHKLLDLINFILRLARSENGTLEYKIETFRLDELLEDCIRAIEVPVDLWPIAITKEIRTPDTAWFKGDRIRMEQILRNLLSNAVKYNRKGGEVHVSCTADSGMLSIRVSDTGIGMPEQEWSSVFESFYRVDTPKYQAEGTGIGLALVKQFAEDLKGKVGLSSQVDSGTIFTVDLPFSEYLLPWKEGLRNETAAHDYS